MDPRPVDLHALSAILGKAKQVMNVVEERNPTAPKKQMRESYDYDDLYTNSPAYSEADEREPIYENYQSASQSSVANSNYTPEQIKASNLPPAIKEAMLNKPIPRLTHPPSKFSAEDIAKITGATIKKPNEAKPRQMIKEGAGSDMITINRVELQNMIDESINRFFKQVYDKTVTEETIKKTINTLIKEGKIQTKRKN